MRWKLLLTLAVFLVGCGGHSTINPPPTSSTITIPVSCPNNGNCGQIEIYRTLGTCPTVLVGSSGWIELATTGGSVFVDSTVSSGVTYSYVGEGVLNGSYSGPSNCVTRTAL